MRDLGAIALILGIEIIRDQANRKMYLSQRKHISDVLDHFQMADSRSVSTPLSKSSPLTKEDCPQSPEDSEYMKSVPYLSAVGSLMYLSVGTRPDISFAVGALSRFNANPGPLETGSACLQVLSWDKGPYAMLWSWTRWQSTAIL